MRHNDAGGTGFSDVAGPQHGVERRRLFVGAGSFFPSLAVGGGRVYVTSRRGELLALDPVDERIVWRYDRLAPGGAGTALADGLVLAASDDGLDAVDPATGSREWRADRPLDGEGPLLVYDGTAYANGADGTVVAVDIATGEETWRLEAGRLGAVADGRVYVRGDAELRAVDAADRGERWRNDDETIVGDAVTVRDGTVYVDGGGQWGHLYPDPGRLYALDAADGSRRWGFRTEATEAFGSLAVAPEAVAAGTGYGSTVHVLGRDDGRQRWCAAFGSRRIEGLAIADGVVYVAAGDAIQARAVDGGDPLWTARADPDERLGGEGDEPAFYHHHALSGGVLLAAGYGRRGLVVDAFLER